MIVDTSAIVASLTDEPDAVRYRNALASASVLIMSAFNIFECRVVLGRRYGEEMLSELNLLLLTLPVEIAPFDREQAALAFRAYQRYGKGSGHPAQLNLGDCCAYALAAHLEMPLLFKGNDFRQTDLLSASDPTQ